MIFFSIFQSLFLQKLFRSWPILLWLGNMLKLYFLFRLFITPHRKNDPNLKKNEYFFVFFKTMVGTFWQWSEHSVTGYLVFKLNFEFALIQFTVFCLNRLTINQGRIQYNQSIQSIRGGLRGDWGTLVLFYDIHFRLNNPKFFFGANIY